jgi:hypothetical protein
MTKDGKFFESSNRDVAERYEDKLNFIENYNKSTVPLECSDDTDTIVSIVPAENIYAWIVNLSQDDLEQFKAMVHEIVYIPTAKDDDE